MAGRRLRGEEVVSCCSSGLKHEGCAKVWAGEEEEQCEEAGGQGKEWYEEQWYCNGGG